MRTLRSSGPRGPDVVLVAESDETALPTINETLVSAPLAKLGIAAPPPIMHYLGVAALGTSLRRLGSSVAVHDNVLRIPAAREAFLRDLDAGPRIVGISITLILAKATLEKLTAWVRQRAPESLLVLGGTGVEFRPDLRALGDASVVGPGEGPLAELAALVKDGRDWRAAHSLCYSQDGREVWTGRAQAAHPDDLPATDWDLFPTQPLLGYPIQASRGCRFGCAYCSGPRGGQVLRGVAHVVAEARRDHERFGIGLLRFTDSDLTAWPEHATALCEALSREGPPLEWSCYSRVDDLAGAAGLAPAMAAAGCTWVHCGVESGSDAILAGMRKGYDRKAVILGVRRAREAGLRVHAFFMVGFPGETRATVDETLEIVDRVAPDTVCFSPLHVPYGSDLLEHRDRYGLSVLERGWAHATMDSVQAEAETRRCYDVVARSMDRVAFGPLVTGLRGSSLSAEEALGYAAAVKEFHRGRVTGDAAAVDRALGTVLAARRRQEKLWAAAGWGRS
ncbi:MAG: radical SAM protein [Elusimicrobia bacterium]|nr:radical SAM protein [Elusimicrobiota bacterium]